jgi:hypothetical protein
MRLNARVGSRLPQRFSTGIRLDPRGIVVSAWRWAASPATRRAESRVNIAELPELLKRPQYCLSVAQFVGWRKRPAWRNGGGGSTAAAVVWKARIVYLAACTERLLSLLLSCDRRDRHKQRNDQRKYLHNGLPSLVWHRSCGPTARESGGDAPHPKLPPTRSPATKRGASRSTSQKYRHTGAAGQRLSRHRGRGGINNKIHTPSAAAIMPRTMNANATSNMR